MQTRSALCRLGLGSQAHGVRPTFTHSRLTTCMICSQDLLSQQVSCKPTAEKSVAISALPLNDLLQSEPVYVGIDLYPEGEMVRYLIRKVGLGQAAGEELGDGPLVDK